METYNEKQLKEYAEKYTTIRDKMRDYSKNRYLNFKKDLDCIDEEKKKKAEDFMNKMKSNSKKHYYRKGGNEQKKLTYNENKSLHLARHRYAYYKKKNKLDKISESKDYEKIKEILIKDDTSRKTAKEKYPELF